MVGIICRKFGTHHKAIIGSEESKEIYILIRDCMHKATLVDSFLKKYSIFRKGGLHTTSFLSIS